MDVIQEVDVLKDIQIIEEYLNVIDKDVKQLNEDCSQINCSAVYQAIENTMKLIIDCITCCFKVCKPKKE